MVAVTVSDLLAMVVLFGITIFLFCREHHHANRFRVIQICIQLHTV